VKKTRISKRRWLFLPVETIARELTAKTLLACVAAERGWGIIVGEKKTVRRKQEKLPRGTFIEKSIHPGRIKDIRKAKENGNRVSAWCEEGLNYLNRDDYCQRRLESQSFDALDYFFAWGKQQADDISDALGVNEKIVLSGNPRFDLLRPELRNIFVKSANEIRRRHGNIILVNTKFSTVNSNRRIEDFDYVAFLHSTGKIKTQEDKDLICRYVDLNKRLFSFFQDLLPVLSKNFSNHTIVVRPHPSENHAPWVEKTKSLSNVKVLFEGNVNEWLMAADVMIHNNCTTGIEAFLLERAAISYRPIKDEIVEHQLPNEVSFQAANTEELISFVHHLVANKNSPLQEERDKKVNFTRKYIANIDGKLACEIIMDYMDRLDLPIIEGVFPLEEGLLKVLEKKAKNLKGKIKQQVNTAHKYEYLYYKQKFPGITLTEIDYLLHELRKASGRFLDIQIAPVDENTFCFFRP
jgi:surface carbohydrate biosynthesis protein